MSTALGLLERCKRLEASEATSAEWARWCDDARELVEPSFEVCGAARKRWTAAHVELAYLLGRVESNLLAGWTKGAMDSMRASSIRRGRLASDLGDSTHEEQVLAAREAHQLKADGIRNFVARVASKYDKDPKTIRKWMQRHPDATRD